MEHDMVSQKASLSDNLPAEDAQILSQKLVSEDEEDNARFLKEIFFHPDLEEPSPTPDGTSFPTINKREWFHSDNLLLILDYLKVTAQGDAGDEKANKEFWMLRHYGLSADFRSNKCHITYQCSHRFQEASIGRVYAYSSSKHKKNTTKQIGLQNIPRWIRAALAAPFYWDLDMVNAHQTLLLGIMDSLQFVNSNPKFLRCAVQHREELLEELGNFSGANCPKARKKVAKEVLTVLFYGGSLESARKSLQELENPLNGNGEDFYLLDGKFGLKGFHKEMEEIRDELWKAALSSSSILHEKFRYLKALVSHPHIETKMLKYQKKSSFLSLFLQTEERGLLCVIEEYLQRQHNRFMDCYIHDGGLIRKSALHKHAIPSLPEGQKPKGPVKLETFDPLQAFAIEEISDYIWEDKFPEHILQACQEHLRTIDPKKYACVRLVVKPFDEQWRQKINTRKECFAADEGLSTIPKTYKELKYYYETHHSLLQIRQSASHLFDGNEYCNDHLQVILPEKLFTTEAILQINLAEKPPPQQEQQEQQSSRSVSPVTIRSRSRSPKTSNLGDRSGGSRFWPKYFYDSKKRTIERVLFCWEELTLSQTKKPYDVMIDAEIARKYYVLYENYRSFDVMRDKVYSRSLGEAFRVCHQSDDCGGDGVDNSADHDPLLLSLLTSRKDRHEFLAFVKANFIFSSTPSDTDFLRSFPFLHHIYLLCDKQVAEFTYVVKYVARALQKPTIKEEGCGLILYSATEGVGKSVAASMILDLFAPFSKETHDAKDVFGQFGLLQENCIVLHLEDTDATEMKQFSSHFKNRITAKTMTVEKKHENKQTKMNLCRYIITTNDLAPLPIGEHDRRWAIIPCSSHLIGNKEYFKSLDLQWALHAVQKSTFMILHSLQLSGFSCERDKPLNPLLKELKGLNMTHFKRFLIGVSFWINKVESTHRGQEFLDIYQKKVYLKHNDAQKEALQKAIWMNSQDLFVFFQQWCPQERNTSLNKFSREVRSLSVNCSAVNDCQGKASLPICVGKWIDEAQNFGMNSQEDSIPLNSETPQKKQISCHQKMSEATPTRQSNKPKKKREKANFKATEEALRQNMSLSKEPRKKIGTPSKLQQQKIKFGSKNQDHHVKTENNGSNNLRFETTKSTGRSLRTRMEEDGPRPKKLPLVANANDDDQAFIEDDLDTPHENNEDRLPTKEPSSIARWNAESINENSFSFMPSKSPKSEGQYQTAKSPHFD